MILHLIRHPRPAIEAGICYGRLDISAEIDAAAIAHLRATLPADLPLWSSPLQRCRRLAEALHRQPRFDERLVEMNFGDWEGRPWQALPRAELDAWAGNVANFVPPGGESVAAVQARSLAFVAQLRVPEAVLVTHAGVIRVLLAHFHGRPIEACLDYQPAYASLISVTGPLG